MPNDRFEFSSDKTCNGRSQGAGDTLERPEAGESPLTTNMKPDAKQSPALLSGPAHKSHPRPAHKRAASASLAIVGLAIYCAAATCTQAGTSNLRSTADVRPKALLRDTPSAAIATPSPSGGSSAVGATLDSTKGAGEKAALNLGSGIRIIRFKEDSALLVANITSSGNSANPSDGDVVSDSSSSVDTVRLPGVLRTITVFTNTTSLTVSSRQFLADIGGVDLEASPGTTVHTLVTATQESTGAFAMGFDEQVARNTPPTESSMLVPVHLVKGSPTFSPGPVTLCYSAIFRVRGVVMRSWTLCGAVDFELPQ